MSCRRFGGFAVSRPRTKTEPQCRRSLPSSSFPYLAPIFFKRNEFCLASLHLQSHPGPGRRNYPKDPDSEETFPAAAQNALHQVRSDVFARERAAPTRKTAALGATIPMRFLRGRVCVSGWRFLCLRGSSPYLLNLLSLAFHLYRQSKRCFITT